jgi:hypothetical protein
MGQLAVSIVERLLRRPQDRLRDYDALAVDRHRRATVELVAEFERLAHAPAERVVVGAGQESVGRQAIRWCGHQGIVSQGPTPSPDPANLGILTLVCAGSHLRGSGAGRLADQGSAHTPHAGREA